MVAFAEVERFLADIQVAWRRVQEDPASFGEECASSSTTSTSVALTILTWSICLTTCDGSWPAATGLRMSGLTP